MQPLVAVVAADRAWAGACSQRSVHRLAGRAVGLGVMPGSLDHSRRAWVFPVLVIEPCDLDWPEELSLGTKPTKDPIVDPLNRCQSPISTASPNPVRVEIPRRHPSRRVTAV